MLILMVISGFNPMNSQEKLEPSSKEDAIKALTGGVPNGRWKEGLLFDGVRPMPWMQSAANWFPGTEEVQPEEIRVTFMGTAPLIRPGQMNTSIFVELGNGDSFVFDMGESVKIFDLAVNMIKLSGLKYPEDIDIKIVGLRPGEKIYEELLADGENTKQTYHEKIMIAKTCHIFVFLLFRIKTRLMNGLIVALKPASDSDYLALKIKTGRPCVFLFQKHAIVSQVCLPETLNDGKWHDLRAFRYFDIKGIISKG